MKEINDFCYYFIFSSQKWYRPIVCKPYLIIEQMLMCTKLLNLEKSINAISEKILKLSNNNPISRPNLDMILRKYASKAVDMRVRRQNKPFVHKVQAQINNKNSFTPPEIPPKKQEWVPNDEVCHQFFFSLKFLYCI